MKKSNLDEMQEQKGDDPVVPFSFLTDRKLENTYSCYLTWTTPETHRIILDNLHRAPLSGLRSGSLFRCNRNNRRRRPAWKACGWRPA